jgi:hypothetical protein
MGGIANGCIMGIQASFLIVLKKVSLPDMLPNEAMQL